LLDRGRAVASGELAALIRRHAEVIVAVASPFNHDGVPGVRKVVSAGDRTLLYLEQATNARDFLNQAHERGLTLGDYTVSHATLQDIFLELVAESRSRPDGEDA
jgi:ABC-type uncharacterized transport system ATPase subunit